MSKPKQNRTPRQRSKKSKKLWTSPSGIAAAAATLVVLVGVGLLLLGNTSQSIDQHGTSSGTTVGRVAPAFSVEDVDGQLTSRSEDRPTILFFMAAWCASCASEERALAQLYRAYGDQVDIISIDIDERSDTPEDVRGFQQRFGGPWPHVLNAKLALEWRVKYLDTTLILNKDGIISYRDEHATNYATLEREIQNAMR